MFEWDEAKDKTNIQKHGVGFLEASSIFSGAVVTFSDDRPEYDEERFVSIGMTGSLAFVVVAHTDRDGVTRIISARRANKRERERYFAEIQK